VWCCVCSMAMSTQVQAQVSKRDTVVLGGNMALRRGLGGGSVTMVLRRQLSPISSVELLAIVGLRSILSLQTSRYLFPLLEVQVVVACGAKAVDRLL
jgi:DnaJ family protein C protein 11